MTIFKSYIYSYKKFLIAYSFFLLILISGIIFVFNDYDYYKDTIVKITNIKNEGYHQKISGRIMNGKYKGKLINLNNNYTYEGVFDEKYKTSEDVFVSVNVNTNGTLSGEINGVKRDKYIAIMLSVLFFIIVVIFGKRGLLIIISLIINVIIFIIALEQYKKGVNIFKISNYIMILFTLISIILAVGLNKKSIISIFSTILTTYIVFLILKIALHFSKNIDYAFMEHISSPNDLSDLFFSQILISALGAIMDISVSVSSMISELIKNDKNISIKKLYNSGRTFGKDIMGTMINVLLFTYICGSLPIVLLKFSNGVSLFTIFGTHIPFMWYRLLLGGIGIIITIPISLATTLGIFYIGREKNV